MSIPVGVQPSKNPTVKQVGGTGPCHPEHSGNKETHLGHDIFEIQEFEFFSNSLLSSDWLV